VTWANMKWRYEEAAFYLLHRRCCAYHHILSRITRIAPPLRAIFAHNICRIACASPHFLLHHPRYRSYHFLSRHSRGTACACVARRGTSFALWWCSSLLRHFSRALYRTRARIVARALVARAQHIAPHIATATSQT